MGDAFWGEQVPNAKGNFIGIRNVGEHVVGKDDISATPFIAQALSNLDVEELAPSRYALSNCVFGNVSCWIDAKHNCTAILGLL